MASVWEQLTLSTLTPTQWRGASLLYHLVGIFRQWRQSSWILQWADPIGALLVSLVFILGPFVSTGLIGILLVALAGYWGLLTLTENRQLGVSPIHLLVLLYWGIAAVAVAFSPVKEEAFKGWLKLTLYLVFFVISARVLQSSRLTNWLVTALLLVSLAVSVYGIEQQVAGVEQLATWNDPTSDLAGATRVYSYLGNPNLLASYLFPAIALSASAIFVWQGWMPKALALMMLFVNSCCLYFTGSRGGFIGMMALGITFVVLSYYWWYPALSPFWQKWLLPLVLGTGAVVAIAAFFGVEKLRLRVLSIFAGREDSSNNFRMNVWQGVINMIKARPILGIGPGNEAFNQVYPLYMRPRYSALSAYSIFLEVTVETGLIGLSIFLWLLLVSVNHGIRAIGRLRNAKQIQGMWIIGAIAAMAGILAHGLVDTVWYRPQISTLWWFMIALIASQAVYPSQSQSLQSSKETVISNQ